MTNLKIKNEINLKYESHVIGKKVLVCTVPT